MLHHDDLLNKYLWFEVCYNQLSYLNLHKTNIKFDLGEYYVLLLNNHIIDIGLLFFQHLLVRVEQ